MVCFALFVSVFLYACVVCVPLAFFFFCVLSRCRGDGDDAVVTSERCESEEVADWLESLGLGEYREVFLSRDIRGCQLPQLQRHHLKEFGITKVGHLKRILQAIEDLNDPVWTPPTRPPERMVVTSLFLILNRIVSGFTRGSHKVLLSFSFHLHFLPHSIARQRRGFFLFGRGSCFASYCITVGVLLSVMISCLTQEEGVAYCPSSQWAVGVLTWNDVRHL